MVEHIHEWEAMALVTTFPCVHYECSVCSKRISTPEVVHRLNATERLSAEDARTLADAYGRPAPEWESGMAYASALEGE